LTTGLWGVKECADEEGERDRRQAEHKQEAQNNTKICTIEETTDSEQRHKEGQKEAEDNAVRDEVTRVISNIRKTHHAHGLLQATTLLKHDLHYNALDVDPECKRYQEGLDSSGRKEVKDSVQQNH